MIYYLSNSITTSVRLYFEGFSVNQLAYEMDRISTNVPTGCIRFKSDIIFMDWQLQDKFTNIIQSTYSDVGGHFAAMEVPHVLFKDFSEFVNKVEQL